MSDSDATIIDLTTSLQRAHDLIEELRTEIKTLEHRCADLGQQVIDWSTVAVRFSVAISRDTVGQLRGDDWLRWKNTHALLRKMTGIGTNAES